MERVWTHMFYQKGGGQIFAYGRVDKVWATAEGVMHHLNIAHKIEWTQVSPDLWVGDYTHPVWGAEIKVDVYPVPVEM